MVIDLSKVQLTGIATANKIENKTRYTIEFTQMIGGYASNNPVQAKGNSMLLSYPGAKLLRGHIMVIDPNVSGKYFDNIIFQLTQAKGQWKFSKVFDLYQKLNLKINRQGNLVIQRKNK